SPPRDRLAPGGNDGAHSRSHRIVGIGGDEFRIAVQRVALQRRGVGFLRGQIANRPRADRGRLFARNGGGRRVGRPLEKHQRGFPLRRVPRDLGPPCHVVDAQPRAIENPRERQAALAPHLRPPPRARALPPPPPPRHPPPR